jgi:hypothetical protein
LAVEDSTIGDDNDGAKEFLASVVVEGGELVGGPGDRVGFAGASAVLDEVTLACAFAVGGVNQLVGDLPLVVAGEDEGFFAGDAAVEVFGFGFLEMEEAVDDFEPSIGLKAAQVDFHAGEFEALAEGVEGAVFFEVADGLGDEVACGVLGVGFAEFLPAIGPGGLDVGEQVFGVEGGGGVVIARLADQPALGGEGVKDVGLEGGFSTVGHGMGRGESDRGGKSRGNDQNCVYLITSQSNFCNQIPRRRKALSRLN